MFSSLQHITISNAQLYLLYIQRHRTLYQFILNVFFWIEEHQCFVVYYWPLANRINVTSPKVSTTYTLPYAFDFEEDFTENHLISTHPNDSSYLSDRMENVFISNYTKYL
ncbi:hypothetical protein I4U23_024813 [Adineta vaga]|nr:hypothetical protein I4U23_024813 [Adineta vaga]